jgi:hypothetical protein
MGIGIAGIGFSATHDALHGAYWASPRVNRLIGCFFNNAGRQRLHLEDHAQRHPSHLYQHPGL